MRPVYPLTKLYFTITVIAFSFLADTAIQVPIALLLLLFSILTPKRLEILKRFVRYILPVVLLIIILNVFIYPESEKWTTFLGVKFNQAGLSFGLKVSLRLFVMSLALLLFFTVTPPHLLATALVMKGASPRLVYIFLHSLQLLITLRKKIEKIHIAQASRGLNLKGNPVKRMRAFFPMLFPLIFSYLSESLERGLALELRGLGIPGRKSYFVELRESKVERTANILMLIGTSVIILWRILGWLVL
jgi:energy-coupling factor transport system permease protein